MAITDEIKIQMGEDWLPNIYSGKIRSLRTRSVSLDIPEKDNRAEVMHTLLGIELKVGRQRFACPDLATARFMRVFARIGCREFAIPYDITKISMLADELETAWQKSLLHASGGSDAMAKRQRSQLFKEVRTEIAVIGPGEKMPEFKQSTKQRTS